MRRPARFVLIAALLLPLLPVTGARADTLTEAEFKDVKKDAGRLMRQEGTPEGKTKLIQRLGADDSARASEVLVDWMRESLRFQQGPLADALAERKKDYDRVLKVLLKAYKAVPPVEKNADGQPVIRWASTDHKNAYEGAKQPYDKALELYDDEEHVRYEISLALERVRDEAAVRWLISEGLATLEKAKPTELAQSAIVRCLTHQSEALAGEALIGFARNAKLPRARILALAWIGERQVAAGYDVAVAALEAAESAVQRAAVDALTQLGDPRCVKPLIDALGRSEAVLATEIEDALHHYIGLSMEGSHSAWMAWWKHEGEAWLAASERSRHGPIQRGLKNDGYGFYGIQTDSKRIVFVLDRSGSMLTPADPESKKTRPDDDKPAPVVTGPGADGGGGRKDPGPPPVVAGDTKIEVARNQLEWSIEQLPKDVLFGVVFFSTDVDVWREPPEMLMASPANKRAAIEWFRAIEASGSTTTFDALMKALDYANTLEVKAKERNNGADTIFLLSDGSPTDKHDGKRLLTAEEIEEALRRFHDANKVFQCVVHTIGIGKEHNAPLLQRIARETGGIYRRAGE